MAPPVVIAMSFMLQSAPASVGGYSWTGKFTAAEAALPAKLDIQNPLVKGASVVVAARVAWKPGLPGKV